MRKVLFLPGLDRDLRETRDQDELVRGPYCWQLLDSVHALIPLLASGNPEFPICFGDVRMAILRFPSLALYYTIDRGDVVVIGIRGVRADGKILPSSH